jgi:hypothetical protein
MLFLSREYYFIPNLVIEEANDKQTHVRIVSHVWADLNEMLFRHDPPDVIGEFRIFAAVFLHDRSAVFEGQIDLSELGKIISHQVFDFVGARARARG